MGAGARGDLAYVGWKAITHSTCLGPAAAKAEAEPDRLPCRLLILPCKALCDLQQHFWAHCPAGQDERGDALQ